ncbi:ABC transporter type 1, transmembrane domain-containing protein [Chlamydoabsidia padenii]|nr:ABC transporter type 1, transmembrane domain-containing protein [Chlamydoabsidia padenii]
MVFVAPFCGSSMRQNNQPILEPDACIRETVMDAILPMAFLFLSLIWNIRRHYRTTRSHNEADYLRLPTTQSSFILRRILFMLVFVLFEICSWAFLFAWRLESVILDHDSDEHSTALYQIVAPSLAILPRVYILVLVIRSFTTPSDSLSPSKFTLYNYHFLLFYSLAITSSFLRCFSYFVISHDDHWLTSWTIEISFAVTNLAINLILWTASATAPSELDQGELLDFDDTDDGVMVLHDGRVVRNGRILSLEANASPLSRITFRWMNPLLLHANSSKQHLGSDQLWALPLRLRSQENDRHFQSVCNSASSAFRSPINISTTSTTTAAASTSLPTNINTTRTQNSTQPSSWSLARQIYRANRQSVVLQFITAISAVLFHYANPFFLQHLLKYIQDPQDKPYYTGYLYCFAIFGCGILSTLVASQTLLWGRRWHVSITNMLDTAIYSHTLKMPYYGKTGGGWMLDGKLLNSDPTSTADHMITSAATTTATLNSNGEARPHYGAKLLSHDVERLAELASHLHIFYTCPLEITAGILFLYHILGYSFFVGLVVMTVTLPMTHLISRKLTMVQKRLGEAKSWRIQLLWGFCKGIKSTKFLAWERKWEEMIMTARGEELVQLIKFYSQNTLLGLIWFATPIFVTTVSFAWYTLVQGNKLDASTAFVSVVLFGMLRDPLNIMPQAFMAYHESRVSLDRIYTFLHASEHMDTNGINNYANVDTDGLSSSSSLFYNSQNRSYEEQVRVGFVGGIFKMSSDQQKYQDHHPHSHHRTNILSPSGSTFINTPLAPGHMTMMVPTFDFPPGELSIITGPSATGKTRLLHALLGEEGAAFQGQAILPSRFLTPGHGTITRDQHHPSLSLLKVAYVSQTPWFETGTIRANILFWEQWDDIRYRSVLLQCNLIKDLSLLENGDLTQVGENGTTLSDTLKAKISLARAMFSKAKTLLIDDIFTNMDAELANLLLERCTLDDGSFGLMKGRTLIIATRYKLGLWAQRTKLIVSMSTPAKIRLVDQDEYIADYLQHHNSTYSNSINKNDGGDDSNAALKTDDHQSVDDGSGGIDALVGSAGNRLVEEDYFDAGSIMRDSILETDDGSHRTTTVSRDLAYATYFTACGGWLFWLSAVLLTVLTRVSALGECYWLKEGMVDLVVSFVTVGFNFIRTIIQYRGSLRASHRLFLGLLQSVSRAPLQFFETTSTKDIMLRFGKDVETIDTNLGLHINFLIQTVIGIVGIVVTIGIILPHFFIAMAIAVFFYCFYGSTYIGASHRLKKLETDTRPLVYSVYTDSLAGLVTIRAYGKQQQMMKKMYQLLDDTMRPFYLLWTTNRWLFIRVEFIGASLSLFLGVLLVYKMDQLDAGLAGIVLTLASSLLEYVYWIMRQSSVAGMHFDAVQHINEYMEMPQEPPGVLDGSRPPAAWPTSAAIQVRDLMIGTSDECILKHVSFTVLPGEKMALVGGGERNGLVLCLFRFLDPLRGSIKIDGVNIAWIGIEDLRSRITFIAKDCDFIGDTVRSNLDPFGEYDDYELWQALYRVHLARPEDDPHEGIIYDLDMTITQDNQSVLSTSDKQLLAMARAFLLDAVKLVVIEEAVNEDHPKMTRIIEEELVDSTVLLIVNNPNHALSYNRVAVFEEGELVEIGRPMELLKDTTSHLYGLTQHSSSSIS